MTMRSRLAAAAAGLLLVGASLLSVPLAHAATAQIDVVMAFVGEPGLLLVMGCDDPDEVSGVVVDLEFDGEVIETQTLAPGEGVVEVTLDEPGDYIATMTCLSYDGVDSVDAASVEFTAIPAPAIVVGEPDGELPVCTGTPVTFSGLTGQPGHEIWAALLNEDGDLLQEWTSAAVIGPDGDASITLTLDASVPPGEHAMIIIAGLNLNDDETGELSGMGLYEVPVGTAEQCAAASPAPSAPVTSAPVVAPVPSTPAPTQVLHPGLPSTGH